MSDNSFTCNARTQKENAELLKFLVEESKKADAPLNVKQLSRDFIEKSGTFRTEDAINKQVPRLLLKVPKMDNIDTETKVRMFFALSASVNKEYLNELLEDAAVIVVDEKQRITKYESNDGSLKLEGNHSFGARVKAGWEEKKRCSGITRDFQEEKGEKDVEEENRQVMTKSGRIVKKPFLYDNSTPNETNKEQMEFDGHDILNQLQNEPVEMQNVKTGSKKKTIKRKVNTQKPKSTKKSKKTKSGGVAESEKEVIYEGPGEPPRPAVWLRKIEPFQEPIVLSDDEEQEEEKKPETFGFFGEMNGLKLEEDVEFGDYPEDAVHNFTAALSESSSMNVSHRSSDSIDIVKVLELLRSLVGTLESPMLHDLHRKIDLKIREFRDQNLNAPIKYIPLSLESAILFLTKNATSAYLEEDSTSLKEFLLMFKALSYNLTSPEFAEFQKALKEAFNQIGNRDKRISFEKIQYGLEHVINFVLP